MQPTAGISLRSPPGLGTIPAGRCWAAPTHAHNPSQGAKGCFSRRLGRGAWRHGPSPGGRAPGPQEPSHVGS